MIGLNIDEAEHRTLPLRRTATMLTTARLPRKTAKCCDLLSAMTTTLQTNYGYSCPPRYPLSSSHLAKFCSIRPKLPRYGSPALRTVCSQPLWYVGAHITLPPGPDIFMAVRTKWKRYMGSTQQLRDYNGYMCLERSSPECTRKSSEIYVEAFIS
jgi:hypothetical protein